MSLVYGVSRHEFSVVQFHGLILEDRLAIILENNITNLNFFFIASYFVNATSTVSALPFVWNGWTQPAKSNTFRVSHFYCTFVHISSATNTY